MIILLIVTIVAAVCVIGFNIYLDAPWRKRQIKKYIKERNT